MKKYIWLSLIVSLIILVQCTNEIEVAEIRVTNNDSTYSIALAMHPIPHEDTVPIILLEVGPLSAKIANFDACLQESIPGVEFGEYEWSISRAWSEIYFEGTLSVYNDKHGTYESINDSSGYFEWLDN